MASNNSDVGEYALKALAEQIFGTKVIEILRDSNKMSYRDIWELSSPTTQCANTIGDAIDGVSDCWLCGFKINMKIPALKPECEHVLPVGQALVFLDLYKHSIHKDITNPEFKKMLELEYRWSHSDCNRHKSDTNFISFDNKGKAFILKDAIIHYLDTLFTGYESINKLVSDSKTKNPKKPWIDTRLKDISDQLNKIINFIDKKTKGLLLLSGIASLFEPQHIALSVRNKLTLEKVEVVPDIETVSKSFDGKTFKSLRYYMEYKNNLTSQISALTEPLSRLIATKITAKDKSYINDLIRDYKLDRGDYDNAIRMYIINIIKQNLSVPFENIMTTQGFKDLYYEYSYFKKTDLFNPFVLELVYMCILCIMKNDLSKDAKLSGVLNNDIEAVQGMWIKRCTEKDDYKMFFCKMTEMFIESNVISKNIIECVNRIDCKSEKKMMNAAKALATQQHLESMWNELDTLLKKAEEKRYDAILKQEEEEMRNAAAILEGFGRNNAARILMGLKRRN